MFQQTYEKKNYLITFNSVLELPTHKKINKINKASLPFFNYS